MGRIVYTFNLLYRSLSQYFSRSLALFHSVSHFAIRFYACRSAAATHTHSPKICSILIFDVLQMLEPLLPK